MTAWYTGRTFYACPCCSGRDERLCDAPTTVPCPWCGAAMVQWTPPGVIRAMQAA
jgi:hypothetical protein